VLDPQTGKELTDNDVEGVCCHLKRHDEAALLSVLMICKSVTAVSCAEQARCGHLCVCRCCKCNSDFTRFTVWCHCQHGFNTDATPLCAAAPCNAPAPPLVSSGVLVMKRSWPSIARTVYGDHERYLSVYMRPYNGYYFTGDGCKRDKDGYYWITGRVDDVLNVSGHR
jgi:acyl-CoA synthetase (AMP-forming)/AMP-acid ligase II